MKRLYDSTIGEILNFYEPMVGGWDFYRRVGIFSTPAFMILCVALLKAWLPAETWAWDMGNPLRTGGSMLGAAEIGLVANLMLCILINDARNLIVRYRAHQSNRTKNNQAHNERHGEEPDDIKPGP